MLSNQVLGTLFDLLLDAKQQVSEKAAAGKLQPGEAGKATDDRTGGCSAQPQAPAGNRHRFTNCCEQQQSET